MVHPTLGIGTISSGYYRSTGEFHGATDITLPIGTKVYAAFAGKVTVASGGCGNGYYCDNCGGGGGNWIEIVTNSNLKARYMHLSQIFVRYGQTVQAGQLIGYSGNSGCTTGPHLHYEMWVNGKLVDPIPYLKSASLSPSNGGIIKKLVIFGGLFYLFMYAND